MRADSFHSNVKLLESEKASGVEKETEKIRELAEDFRSKIEGLPFEIVSGSMSNAISPLHPITAFAYDIFIVLKNKYGI